MILICCFIIKLAGINSKRQTARYKGKSTELKEKPAFTESLPGRRYSYIFSCLISLTILEVEGIITILQMRKAETIFLNLPLTGAEVRFRNQSMPVCVPSNTNTNSITQCQFCCLSAVQSWVNYSNSTSDVAPLHQNDF